MNWNLEHHTGGGCMAIQGIENGIEFLITTATDGEALPKEGEPCWLGAYDYSTGESLWEHKPNGLMVFIGPEAAMKHAERLMEKTRPAIRAIVSEASEDENAEEVARTIVIPFLGFVRDRCFEIHTSQGQNEDGIRAANLDRTIEIVEEWVQQ